MAYLVLVRHGLSTYNKQGLWAGWDDPPLTSEGIDEARRAGKALKDIRFDFGYTNSLQRCAKTLKEIKLFINQNSLPTIQNKAINERNYGDFTRQNKWQVEKQLGKEEFLKLRRSWDYLIPNGESLKQVYERETPYFESEILPKLVDDQIANLEIGTGEVYVYKIDENGIVISKEIRAANLNLGKQ